MMLWYLLICTAGYVEYPSCEAPVEFPSQAACEAVRREYNRMIVDTRDLKTRCKGIRRVAPSK